MKECDHNLVVKKKELNELTFVAKCKGQDCPKEIEVTYAAYRYAGGRYNGEELYIRKAYQNGKVNGK